MTVSSILANPSATGSALAKANNSNTAATTGVTSTSSAAATLTNPGSALNQQDFLKLLVAQIQYQDPMNPQSDTAIAAQLAQFTSLQQATQSSASLSMIQANSLVGSTVTVQVDAKNSASGVVTGVLLNNGVPQITIGGANYNLSQITSITPPSASSAVATGGSTGGTPTSGNQTTP